MNALGRGRWWMLAGVACLLVLATGCSKSIGFSSHAPFPSSVSYPQPLVIVVPDDIDKEQYTVKMSGAIAPRRFRVFWGQAMRHEAHARFARMFSQVVVVSESLLEELTAAPPEEPLALLPGLEPLAEQQESESSFETDFIPEFVRGNRGYLLRLSNPRYIFEQSRSHVVMDVEFRDRFLDMTLMQGKVRGRGSAVSPSDADMMMMQSLQRSARAAFSMAFQHVRDQMIAAIEDPPAVGSGQ
ncbi:MAG: hypothetical protein KF858_16190 [Candidatus Sumerlaeia bacterium]|nr:hypothetical protein [Candidatus Sumerlaeia bacterium]